MERASLTGLRVVLALAGAIITYTGLNVALGGIPTLGWQGEKLILEAANERTFLVQDSNVRFFGGLWIGIGLFFLVAPLNLVKHRAALRVSFALIFVGGLARLSQMRLDVTFGPEILGSSVAELVGMPLLYVWLSKVAGVSIGGR